MLVALVVLTIVCFPQFELKMLIMWVIKIGICMKSSRIFALLGIIKEVEDWLNSKLYKVGVPKSWYIQVCFLQNAINFRLL